MSCSQWNADAPGRDFLHTPRPSAETRSNLPSPAFSSSRMRRDILCVSGTASMRAMYLTDRAAASHDSMRTSAGAVEACAAGAANAAALMSTSRLASRTCMLLVEPDLSAPVAALAALFRRAALEPLDAAAGVDELLAARVERVAVRADLDVQLGLRRARGELVAARAPDAGLDVLGMNRFLHGNRV